MGFYTGTVLKCITPPFICTHSSTKKIIISAAASAAASAADFHVSISDFMVVVYGRDALLIMHGSKGKG